MGIRMIDLDRVPLLGMVVVLVAGALFLGAYAFGHSTVASSDEAASARDQAFQLGHANALREAQPEARRRGRVEGRRAGEQRAFEVIDDYFTARRLRSEHIAASRALARRTPRIPRVRTTIRLAPGQRGRGAGAHSGGSLAPGD